MSFRVALLALCYCFDFPSASEVILGRYSLNGRTSCRQISLSLEAERLSVIMIVSLWNLTGFSAALLSKPRRENGGFETARDLVASVRLVNRGPELAKPNTTQQNTNFVMMPTWPSLVAPKVVTIKPTMWHRSWKPSVPVSIMGSGQNFPDDIFWWIFLNENVCISIKISFKFVITGPVNNIPALVQIIAWRRPGDKPVSESMMVSLLTHTFAIRPRWVNIMDTVSVSHCYNTILRLLSFSCFKSLL